MLDTNYSDIFFSNDRDLAIGQGDSKGIIIEINPNEKIYGIVSRRKPTWEYLYQQGKAEFIGTANIQRDYQDSVVSITILPNLKGDRVKINRIKNAISNWESVKNKDGSITYYKPDSNDEIKKPN